MPYSIVDKSYSNIHYFNPDAKVVIVGISPGPAQTRKINSDYIPGDVKHNNKIIAFGGPLRKNLVDMLNSAGVNKYLNIDSCDSLWGDGFDLVNHVSLLPYSTIKCRDEKRLFGQDDIYEALNKNKETNYRSGGYISTISLKAIRKSSLLNEAFDEFLNDLHNYKNNPICIALGTAVFKVLKQIKQEEGLDIIILPFVHPSGQNKASGLIDAFKDGFTNKPMTKTLENAIEYGNITRQYFESLTKH